MQYRKKIKKFSYSLKVHHKVEIFFLIFIVVLSIFFCSNKCLFKLNSNFVVASLLSFTEAKLCFFFCLCVMKFKFHILQYSILCSLLIHLYIRNSRNFSLCKTQISSNWNLTLKIIHKNDRKLTTQ